MFVNKINKMCVGGDEKNVRRWGQKKKKILGYGDEILHFLPRTISNGIAFMAILNLV